MLDLIDIIAVNKLDAGPPNVYKKEVIQLHSRPGHVIRLHILGAEAVQLMVLFAQRGVERLRGERDVDWGHLFSLGLFYTQTGKY